MEDSFRLFLNNLEIKIKNNEFGSALLDCKNLFNTDTLIKETSPDELIKLYKKLFILKFKLIEKTTCLKKDEKFQLFISCLVCHKNQLIKYEIFSNFTGRHYLHLLKLYLIPNNVVNEEFVEEKDKIFDTSLVFWFAANYLAQIDCNTSNNFLNAVELQLLSTSLCQDKSILTEYLKREKDLLDERFYAPDNNEKKFFGKKVKYLLQLTADLKIHGFRDEAILFFRAIDEYVNRIYNIDLMSFGMDNLSEYEQVFLKLSNDHDDLSKNVNLSTYKPLWPEQYEKLNKLRTNLRSGWDEKFICESSPKRKFEELILAYRKGVFELIKSAIESCQQWLGEAPCKWTLAVKGSYARGDMGPYSDLDIICFIDDINYINNPYFKIILDFIHLHLICLGEPCAWDKKTNTPFPLGLHLDKHSDIKAVFNTPENLALLLKQNPETPNIELNLSLLIVEPIYSNRENLCEKYKKEVSKVFGSFSNRELEDVLKNYKTYLEGECERLEKLLNECKIKAEDFDCKINNLNKGTQFILSVIPILIALKRKKFYFLEEDLNDNVFIPYMLENLLKEGLLKQVFFDAWYDKWWDFHSGKVKNHFQYNSNKSIIDEKKIENIKSIIKISREQIKTDFPDKSESISSLSKIGFFGGVGAVLLLGSILYRSLAGKDQEYIEIITYSRK